MRGWALLLASAVFVGGCQTPPPASTPVAPAPVPPAQPRPAPPSAPVTPPPPPVVPTPTPAERALAAGVALYDAGDYAGSIRALASAREIWDDPAPSARAAKLSARKYIAFSYCVTNRRPQCRQQFIEALQLDPEFSLDPAERTHPIWGVEFERAKKQASAPPPRPTARPAPPPAAK